MSSPAIQAFNAKVAASADLQEKLESLQSPVELIILAKQAGIELTGEDLQAIAQTAFCQWITQLDGSIRAFFEHAQSTPDLNQKVKQCRVLEEVISLGREYSFEFTEADLQQAATAAQAVEGFSFEKLWFKGLGMIGGPS